MRAIGKSSVRCGLAAWAAIALVGLGAPSPASAAKPVCCFRVTIDVAGSAFETYSKGPNWVPGYNSPDSGNYIYDWAGSAYALSQWDPSDSHSDVGVLQPIGHGLVAGSLYENSSVNIDGKPFDDCTLSKSQTNPSFLLKKASRIAGLVDFLGHFQTFTLGPPADTYKLVCHGASAFATDDLAAAESDPYLADDWQSERFFATDNIRGLSSKKLGNGQSEQVLCSSDAGQGAIDGPTNTMRSVNGGFAYYINIVHFPASEKKRNERRLKGLQGKLPKANNPAHTAVYQNNPPKSGCKGT